MNVIRTSEVTETLGTLNFKAKVKGKGKGKIVRRLNYALRLEDFCEKAVDLRFLNFWHQTVVVSLTSVMADWPLRQYGNWTV
jgi:hypothetical protein